MPMWLAVTSMLSASAPGGCRQQPHATMPSERLKIEVVGTGGASRTRSCSSTSSSEWPLASS
jgi:hypothetical protein